MTRVRTLLKERDGVARRADFERAGIGRRELDRAVAAGAVLRLRKGVYALPEAQREVITAARHGGALGCGAALKAHGIWVLEGKPASDATSDAAEPRVEASGSGTERSPRPRPHVWIGPSGRRHRHEACVCRVHNEVWESAPVLGIVGVVLALLQFSVCASRERFFAALESALRLGLISDSGVRALRRRVPAAMRWVIDLAGSSADSGLESLLRFRLHLLGISLRSQVLISGVGWVDFVLGGRIILEVDGRENHEGPSLRHKDLMRDASAAAQGYETLRFDYAMVVHDWDRVLAAILRRLRVVDPAAAREVSAVLQEPAAVVQEVSAGAGAKARRVVPPAR